MPVLILVGIAFVAIFADVLAPYDPEIGALGARFARPPGRPAAAASTCSAPITWDATYCPDSSSGPGCRWWWASLRFSSPVSSAPLLGIVSGYLGGWVDQVIMRITDTWLALPALTFAIFLTAIVGPSMWNIVIILGLVYWTRYARVIRGEVLSLKEREFVKLAIVAGCSKRTIMRRHILPNVINSAIVLGTLMLGVVIVTEAALSFLGVGVPPPMPAWGLMLADGKKGMMVGYWWLTVLPGACIMLMVLSANLLGDWLRVKLDPQLRQL